MRKGINDDDCRGVYCTFYFPVFYTLKQTNRPTTTVHCRETMRSVRCRDEEDAHRAGEFTTALLEVAARQRGLEPEKSLRSQGGCRCRTELPEMMLKTVPRVCP